MTIDLSEPRTQRAIVALEHCGQWLKVRDESGRPVAYGIPSAVLPDLYHFANSTQCTCPDHAHGHHCWHSRAVALHVAAQAPKPVRLVPTRISDEEIVWDRARRG